MNHLKTILASGAAVFATVAGAQAADLPSAKSAPVSYVRICDVYGAGFFYIPGTQTCLRVGGRVRFEFGGQTLKSGIRHQSAGAVAFINKNGLDQIGWNSRGYLNMDARTQTAWGTVQTVIIMRINSASGIYGTTFFNTPAGNAFTPTLENAYIRFAGFTFGRAYSNVEPIPPYMWNADQSGGFGAGIKQIAYTATFGGGFSATLGIEDKNDSGPMVTANAIGAPNILGGPAATATAVGPSRLPVVAGNLRVDQAWGWAQLSGAVGQNTANFATPAALAVVNGNGPLVKSTGWYVGAATRINLPMIAAGDHLHLQAQFANGLINYVGPEANGGNGKIGPWNGGLIRADRNLTLFCGPVVCSSEQTKSWSALAMFTHYWAPSVRQNLSASYQVITPGAQTRANPWGNGGLSTARQLSLGTNVIWSPVAGFDIGLELTYARLQQNFNFGVAGGAVNAASAAAVVAACAVPANGCFKASSNVFSARMRVERTF